MPYLQFTIEELASEEWRPVVEWEEFYAVSNLGRVKRLQGCQCRYDRVLRIQPHEGYPHVTLCVLPKRQFIAVHRLVAKTFLGPYPLNKEVNHIDHNKMNPRLGNLEYVTRKENIEKAVQQGRLQGRRRRVLKSSDIPIIRRMLSDGCTQSVIAQLFNVSRDAISGIKRGLNWKHVPIDG